MKYDEMGISVFGELVIEKILKSRQNFSFTTHNEREARLIYAIENYILKYQNNPKSMELKESMEKFKNELLNSFMNNPLLVNYSFLLTNPKLVNFTQSQQQKFEIGKRNLTENLNQIYINIMNNHPVSTYDKARLMTFFSLVVTNEKNLNYNRKKFQEKIKKYTTKILTENNIPTSEYELKFLFNYVSTLTFSEKGYYGIKPTIRIVEIENDDNSFTGGYNCGMYIAMNAKKSHIKGFYDNLQRMIQCAAHENTHAIQEIESVTKKNSIHGLEMTIQKLFGMKEYKTGENYLFNEIEEDAQRNGYYIASIFYGIHNREDIARTMIQEKSKYIKERRFQYEYVTITNQDGTKKKISKEKFNVENIRKIVSSNYFELVKKYPSLDNVFNQDGTPKTLEKMLEEKKISFETEKMYEDFIIYEIRYKQLNSINMSRKTEEEKRAILYKLNNILYNRISNIINVLKDYDYRKYNSKKTIFFYEIYLKDVITISSFLEKNLEFMRLDEKRGNDNVYYNYSQYTTRIRSLMYNIELYQSSGKLSNLEKSTQKYKNDLDRLDNNIKKEYLKNLLSKFSKEEKSTIIYYNNQSFTLENFITIEIFKMMDREHYIHNETGKILFKEDGSYLSPLEFIRTILINSKNKQKNSTQNFLPTFEKLHDLVNKYTIEIDFNNPQTFKVVDIKTKQVITDESLKESALFANLWLAAAGTKIYANDNRPGERYAFNEPAKKVYKLFCQKLMADINNIGVIDTVGLVKDLDYVSYKYAKEIVIGMFRTPFQTQFINKYFKKFSSIPIIQDSNPETLYNFYYTSQLLQKSQYEEVNGHKK